MAKQPPVVRAEAAKRRLALIPEPVTVGPGAEGEVAGGAPLVRRLSDVRPPRRLHGLPLPGVHLDRAAPLPHAERMGIDPATYVHLFDLQGGRCAICRGRPKTTRLAVDHDHGCCTKPPLCGRCTRGLLCSRCNHELLGAAHD